MPLLLTIDIHSLIDLLCLVKMVNGITLWNRVRAWASHPDRIFLKEPPRTSSIRSLARLMRAVSMDFLRDS